MFFKNNKGIYLTMIWYTINYSSIIINLFFFFVPKNYKSICFWRIKHTFPYFYYSRTIR